MKRHRSQKKKKKKTKMVSNIYFFNTFVVVLKNLKGMNLTEKKT